MKKVVALLLVFTMVLTIMPHDMLAAKNASNVKPADVTEDLDTFLKNNFTQQEIKDLKADYEEATGKPFDEGTKKGEGQIQSAANYNWVVLVIVAALGAILRDIIVSSTSYAWSWLRSQTARDGRDCGSSNVKISHQMFSASSTYNYIGDGRANPYIQTKALQNYINRTNIAWLNEDGKWGPKTKAGTIALQKRLGVTADGVVGKNTWYAMAGPCR